MTTVVLEYTIRKSELAEFRARLEMAEREGLQGALNVIQAKVRDLTPRLHGGLAQGVSQKVEGLDGAVKSEGVVAWVHENNAQWSKQPPVEAMRLWVEEKLGLSGPEGDSVAFLIGRKILQEGLTLPNKELRGKMYSRVQAEIDRTNFHFTAFVAAFKAAMGSGMATGGISNIGQD